MALPSLARVHSPILVSNLASGDLDLRHGKHASKRSDKQHKSPTITGATDKREELLLPTSCKNRCTRVGDCETTYICFVRMN